MASWSPLAIRPMRVSSEEVSRAGAGATAARGNPAREKAIVMAVPCRHVPTKEFAAGRLVPEFFIHAHDRCGKEPGLRRRNIDSAPSALSCGGAARRVRG